VELKNFRFAVAFTLLSAVAGHAQYSNSSTSLTANPVYQQNCAKCHGKTGEGRFMAGPSLVSDKTSAVSANTLRDIIVNGKHRMPKFGEKLPAPDIDALVTLIKAQQIEAHKKP
jgi:mono/diheme cytochrome c family protein